MPNAGGEYLASTGINPLLTLLKRGRDAMPGTVKLTINGQSRDVSRGAMLADAASQAGFRLASECGSGTCESCRLEFIDGQIDDGGSRVSGTVLACMTRLVGDAEFRLDPAPAEMKTTGVIIARRELSREIVEVKLRVAKPVPYLPGQYVRLAIGTAPERALCPTLTLDGLRELDELVFHVRPAHQGALESQLLEGRKVKLRGPFGAGFLRQGHGSARNGRIVLVASAAGFAPIWSIAVAARLGQPDRPLSLILSARDPRNLYMRPALGWLAQQDVSDIILTASGAVPMPPARHGRASEHLPALVASDTVHVAGDAAMCKAIQRAAHQAGARCHAIPFLASGGAAEVPGLAGRITRLLRGEASATVTPVRSKAVG